MRLLFTSPVLEHPAAGGPQLRIENSIKALARIGELDIVSRAPLVVAGGSAAEDFYRRYCYEFHIIPGARRLSGNRYVRKMQKLLAGICRRDVRREADYLLAHADRRRIRHIWFGYGNISYPLIARIKKLRPDITLVCDTDSVWSRFVLRELPYIRNPLRYLLVFLRGKRKEAEERAWVNLCDVTTAVSDVDADYYRGLASDPSRVQIFSNVIDLESYRHLPPPPPGFKTPCLYLAGTFGHANSPMDTAARWVLEEVWPLVKVQIPGVHFYIVGKDSDRMWGHWRGEDITVTGKLPSVLPYLCHADVALVPLKFESGTRFKILEAGACKVPLISTRLGAEGIPVTHGVHMLIADAPEEFARAVIRLIQDKAYASSLAENCYKLVYENYSVERLARQAQSILGGLS